MIDTLRVNGRCTSFRLATVLRQHTSIRVIALDATAKYSGVGAIVATILIVAKDAIGICRPGGTILGSRICIATTCHCLIIRSDCVTLLTLYPVEGAWQKLCGCGSIAVGSTALKTLSSISRENAHIAVILIIAGFALGIIGIGTRRIGTAASHSSVLIHLIQTHLCRRRTQLIKARPVCRSCGALCLRAVAVAAQQELVAQLARAFDASWRHTSCSVSVLKTATFHVAIFV